uniref:TIR domain-containing protein n=1 Tax=Fagus sylvatica TaxID=28930 RepID=A0A2N9G7D4_FAGSY
MASMSTKKASLSSSSSPSSSDTPQWTYDVFLSFRGEDTRNNFTDHLFDALKQKGIYTFKDDEKLERGKSISPELEKAIEESRFAIVIFSRNYASSTWCLEELAKIVRCKKVKGMTVLPIFYNVDPSDVRKQKGTFAQAFVEHEERFKESMKIVQTWRDALIEVANLSGWDLKDRPESKFIQNIVGELWLKLSYASSEDLDDLVGIISRAEKLKSHLATRSNDVRIIGVWGMGGIGSRVIITTRDKQLLQILKVDDIYDADGLNDDEALHLLSLKAFKKDQPPTDYLELSKDVVHYVKGLPLAIEILGSNMFGRSISEWKRNIVHQDCLEEPGKRSRLWSFEDINDVLTKNTGTEAIQGMVLELLEPKEAYWRPESFSKLHHLKLLIIDSVHLSHDPKHLPNSLRIIDWSGYPTKSIPSKSFERLKSIRLRKSPKLVETLDFTKVPVLEKLVLEDCINLPGVHPSIGVHKKLKVVSLKGCKNLKSLPSKFEMESLEILILSGCSKVKKIPEFGGSMECVQSVEELDVSETAIRHVPSSIGLLKNLKRLSFCGCKGLSSSNKSWDSLFNYPDNRYDLVIPGSEIPEWFTHQSMGDEANIKEPSNLCNEWMGIALCVVFHSHPHHQVQNEPGRLDFWFTANGKRRFPLNITIPYILSDHLWLLYLSPSYYKQNAIKLLWECDANGFAQIGIKIDTKGTSLEVKKLGFRMVYKKDIEDLNRITAQCSNNNITPYDGIDVLHHNFNNSTVAPKGNKIKRSRDDYDGAGLSGEGSSNDIPNPKRIERLTESMAYGNSDCKELSDSD